MRKYILISILSMFIGGVGVWLILKPGSSGREAKGNEKKILFYRHPMNPEATSPIPKKDEMGMDYVPVYEEPKSSGERKIKYYVDPMHPAYKSDKPGTAPDCGMDLVPVYEGEEDNGSAGGVKIDPVYVQNIGVKSEIVQRKTLSRVIRTVGRVDFDETKVYNINSKISGWIEKLYVDYMGKKVRRGDPLMEIYSPDLVTAQQEYINAIRYANSLSASDLPDVIKSATEMANSARRRLLFWDISQEQLTQLEKTGEVQKTMTMYSPYNGVAVEKMVFEGAKVMMGMNLFKIADLSVVWVLADVYQYELPWVRLNQEAEIELSYLSGKVFKGRITYVYPTLNMESRTVKVRIEVVNPSGEIEIKPEMFANVRIKSNVSLDAIVVPDQAIIRTGSKNIAVIDLGNGYFDPRDVKLGVSADGYVQILEGIQEGEKIVTSSQFLIDSESNLRSAVNKLTPNQTEAPEKEKPGHDMKSMDKKESDMKDMNMQKPDEHKDHDMNSMKSSENL